MRYLSLTSVHVASWRTLVLLLVKSKQRSCSCAAISGISREEEEEEEEEASPKATSAIFLRTMLQSDIVLATISNFVHAQ